MPTKGEGGSMGFTYNRLWKKRIDEDMNNTDLQRSVGLSAATVAKLGKNETVNMDILARICEYFHCELDEIINYIPDKHAGMK